jgi:hypothetical protein
MGLPPPPNDNYSNAVLAAAAAAAGRTLKIKHLFIINSNSNNKKL